MAIVFLQAHSIFAAGFQAMHHVCVSGGSALVSMYLDVVLLTDL